MSYLGKSPTVSWFPSAQQKQQCLLYFIILRSRKNAGEVLVIISSSHLLLVYHGTGAYSRFAQLNQTAHRF